MTQSIRHNNEAEAECLHCGTVFDVPENLIAVAGTSTAKPAAYIKVWGLKPGQKWPAWDDDLVLHICRAGVCEGWFEKGEWREQK